MDDRDRIARVVYGEWARLRPWQRARAHWLTDQAMVDWLDRLFPPPKLEPPLWLSQTTAEPTYTKVASLLGKPIKVREGAEGCRLVCDNDPEPGSVFAFA